MAETTCDILLTTLNSTYQHCSFGLRYLTANLKEYSPHCTIHEFTIKQNTRAIVEKILSFQPQIVGFGVYIWNTQQTLEVLQILKRVAPHIRVVLGGPEVTYETHLQEHRFWSDFIIQGEGEIQFYKLVQRLFQTTPTAVNTVAKTSAEILPPLLPEVKELVLPYSLYNEEDILNRIIYVEASRGCPYRCEYCLSSLDKSVRSFELEGFLSAMKILIEKGAKQFKFVDRTFNLSIPTSTRILQFFLEEMKSQALFVHFEMVPDRLPVELRQLIEQFPKGSLQFEVGLQTINPQVSATISRKNDLKKVSENFKYLKAHTGVYTHADLIVGLPGEDLASFAKGFNYLLSLEPTEIQVGILKRLRGAPIARHDHEFKMVYQPTTPYQILSTRDLSFTDLQRMNRFAKFWDTIANSHYFPSFIAKMKELFLQNDKMSDEQPNLETTNTPQFFEEFLKLSDALSEKYSEAHSIAIEPLGEFLFHYTKTEFGLSHEAAYNLFANDFAKINKFSNKTPKFLLSKDLSNNEASRHQMTTATKNVLPKRQQRFVEAN